MNILTAREVAGAVERAVGVLDMYTWDDDVIETKAKAAIRQFAEALVEELSK